MRRVVSQVPSTPKTTWFSWTPSSIVPPAVVSRRSSSSARAGTIASRSGDGPSSGRLLVREPVRVGRRHHELAVAEPDEDPGQHGPRLVARDRPAHARRASRAARRRRACAATRRSTSGSRGKSSAPYVFSRYCAEPQLTCRTLSSSRCSIVTSLSGRRRERSTSSRPGTTTAPSPSTWASRVGADRELHVGRGKLEHAAGGANENPAEDLHGGPRRDTPADDRELLRELLARARRSSAPTRPWLLSFYSFKPLVVVRRECEGRGRQ